MAITKEERIQSIGCCQTGVTRSSSKGSLSDSDTQINNNTLFNSFDFDHPKHEPVDIEFQNIKYTVRQFSMAKRNFVKKEILHGIYGAFRAGELTAIMGPSGSGKSTLMNVLTGYRLTGITGTVQVNGKIVNTSSEQFRRLSCYIHQNDLLRPTLTVFETMMLAAHLKLGFKVSREYKVNKVNQCLMLLGLEHRNSLPAARLSGGQRKRLAIALELLSNPSVLYLDEPTTGLDSSSCVQCVSLLKRLTQHGHTVVCIIHQPSALIFEMFDKLYAVAEGNCIYQGPVKELVTFLSDLGLQCPSYHNPADYLLEVAVGEHDRDMPKLINAATKKYYEDSDLHQLTAPVNHIINQIQDQIELGTITTKEKKVVDLKRLKSGGKAVAEFLAEGKNLKERHQVESASFIMQYVILLQRILMCSSRNYFLLLARIISHIFIAIIFGYLYLNVGPTANTVLGNYVYLYGTILLIVYTGKMSVVLSFPLEIEMLHREHFNRWYKLIPYFLSTISFEIPFQMLCCSLYIGISFYLTGNYSEDFRFYYFWLMGILATLSAQAWGFFVGATLPVRIAVFVGPILAVLFSVFGFCTRYVDITPLFRWMWHISYFRAGFHGVINAIYGMDRPFLICPEKEMYCHFRSPKVFLREMMISDLSMSDSIWLMSVVIIIMHILTVSTLWYKLNKR
ncbi:unnamed protein product [Hermetia illucens]|uniref:ABC transporter domain-containing protein n=1 Tax=Hermetia illucens TaxID=343691 RepID=A0A7R8UEH4_HERIL|nr:ATP-binding cassette sub-family G member 1 [Hermetia illucens]XP_037925464.1 ATP-binding cassette sub-family G member 1 [Hermetia illucens]XP_037925474.1 ATP-binding cassette sub-family G member 1 [Hermetia illucens]CAD7079303.1 unnamed protein product [Hermetia illucens]